MSNAAILRSKNFIIDIPLMSRSRGVYGPLLEVDIYTYKRVDEIKTIMCPLINIYLTFFLQEFQHYKKSYIFTTTLRGFSYTHVLIHLPFLDTNVKTLGSKVYHNGVKYIQPSLAPYFPC